MAKKNVRRETVESGDDARASFVRDLHGAYGSVQHYASKIRRRTTSTDGDRRAAEALRAILNASLIAALTVGENESEGLRELEAMRTEAEASLGRLARWRTSHPRTPPEPDDMWPIDVMVDGELTRTFEGVELPAQQKADEQLHFAHVLRSSLSFWRLPPPSPVRKHPPTLRAVAAQLALALEHSRAIVEVEGCVLPAHADTVDAIMRAWAAHTEAHGEYQLGDSGSEQMMSDAFRALGLPPISR